MLKEWLGSGFKLKQTIGRQVKEGLLLLEQYLKQKSSTPATKRESSERRQTSATPANMPRPVSSEGPSPTHEHIGYVQQDDRQDSIYDQSRHFVSGVVVTANQDLPMSQYHFSNTRPNSFGNPISAAYSTQAVALGDHGAQVPYEGHHVPTVQDVDGNIYLGHDASNGHGAYAEGNVYEGDNLSWYQYTQTITSGIGPQDYQPATALLQLGGHAENNESFNRLAAPNRTFDSENVTVPVGQAWPLIILDPQSDQA